MSISDSRTAASAAASRNRKDEQSGDSLPKIAPTRRRTSTPNVKRLLPESCIQHAKRFAYHLGASGQKFLLADQVQEQLEDFLGESAGMSEEDERSFRRVFRGCQEAILDADFTYFLLRPRTASKLLVRLHPELEGFEEVSREEFLEVKDAFVQGLEKAARPGLVLDFRPFFAGFPHVSDAREMGEGISFLNRHLSAQMYQNPAVFRGALLQFLQDCRVDGTSILVNEHLTSPEMMAQELDAAEVLLEELTPERPYSEIAHELRTHGFERGWGNMAGTIRENLRALRQVLDSSDSARFEKFLARLPLVRTVLMVSPHGWFAQDDVLGKPDTGGQVTYVLDQTRAMEKRLIRQFEESGLETKPRIAVLTRLIPNAEGTTCNVHREKIHGTEDCWIIRVPFRDERGEVLPDWISRFQIWPYLESFAAEARHLVVTELLGRPDLIIGHYSDGNLAAYLLAEALETTHCAAVHALEKTKYLLSDMHWADMEREYRFSLQFTADLISYNSADYVISSSYREIGGTDKDMGMFESYETFSMPGLYRVISGMDPRLARHNIVPPGASEEYFFPHTECDRRVGALSKALAERFLSAEPAEGSVGHLERPDLPVVFAMARMDKIKNLGGLAEIFGRSAELRGSANLFIISSITDPALSSDEEEITEIHRMCEVIDRYDLDGHIRWSAARLNKVETGEIYRTVADRRGVFAQPAFMETFGLTVVEAMACGLPVVVTCFGGPAEIVEPGVSGEVHNPNHHQEFGGALRRILADNRLWERYSRQGIERAEQAFSWTRHAERVVQIGNVHAYWNYLDVMNRQALDRYIHTLYHTVYRPRLAGF